MDSWINTCLYCYARGKGIVQKELSVLQDVPVVLPFYSFLCLSLFPQFQSKSVFSHLFPLLMLWLQKLAVMKSFGYGVHLGRVWGCCIPLIIVSSGHTFGL